MGLPQIRNYVRMSVVPMRKKVFLHHFNICDKIRDHTTDIDPFLLGEKFDIFISGTFAEQNETYSQMYYAMFIIIP